MKKFSLFWVGFTLGILLLFSSCTYGKTPDYTVDLAQTPVVADGNSPAVQAKENMRVDFIVPEPGYLKLLCYDYTEYEEWPELLPEAYATFVDEKGKELYPETGVFGGYVEKYYFEAGKVTAEIRFDMYNDKMDSLALIWAFAPDSTATVPVELDSENPAVAVTNSKGQAKFSFTATQDALYRFVCAEACIFESNCDFYIENANGERVSGNINVLGTEWAVRHAFLPKGDYTVTVFNIDAVASCSIGIEKSYENVIWENEENLTLPVRFGFNSINCTERTATFVSDGSAKKLIIRPDGSGSYYDYQQGYTLKITDSDGNIVLYNEEDVISDYYYEGEQRFDLTGCKGEFTVSVVCNDCCVIDMRVE
ncbi:MAG: hypothetical protein IKK85_01195 [Clostridia bacterium]|nr:hypothetical protein [Clostridia bacterium]